MKKAITWLLVWLWLGAAAMLPAQQSTPRPEPSTRIVTEAYRISGKVVDAHTGSTLPHTSVRISDTRERGQSRATTSGEGGAFTFDGLAPGKYSLSAEGHGYMQQSYEQHEQLSTAIAVGPGLNSEGLVFPLTAEGVIQGTVTDEAGEPVRNAQVRLFEDVDTTGIRTTQQRQTVMTDDRGVYQIIGLRPGAYFLLVTARPWYAQRLHQAQAETPDQDAGSSPSQALDVAYPTTFYPGVTDQDAAVPIPIKGGDRLEANLTLAAQPAIRLRVKLPQGGEPGGPGVSIALSQTIFGQVEQIPVPMTGIQGGLEIEGILPGHYDVTVNRFAPGQGETGAKHFATDITSGATELSEDAGIDAIPVSGKVVSDSGPLPQSAGMSLRTPNSRRSHHAVLKENGDFSLEVPPGTYEVLGNMTGMHIVGLKATGAQLAGRMLTLKAGDIPRLEVVAGTGHGEIEGTALLNGKPAGGVMVLLAPEDAKDNQILFRRDQSDSDGTFTLANVFPGRYRLLAIEDGWELEWANPAVLQVFLAKSIPVEIKSGDELKKTIEVQRH